MGGAASDASSLGEKASPSKSGRFSRGVYFMGKAVWAKGYSELIDLLGTHKAKHGAGLSLDVYGSGPDMPEIAATATERKLGLNFLGAKDHQDPSFREYKVFVNPSLSDVVATTTAEALAMGKFVIVADHPSNDFFSQFKNCMVYKTAEEFSTCVNKAMSIEPEPLSAEDRHRLTWEAATERFMKVAEPGAGRRKFAGQALDWTCFLSHHALANFEPFRKFAGAGKGTKHAPEELTGFDAGQYGGGGFFDRARMKASAASAR